jgi:diacylglycerol kinase (ATP)
LHRYRTDWRAAMWPEATVRDRSVTSSLAMIVNPAAGGGRCGRLWPALASRLEAMGLFFSTSTTARPGDGTTLARAALRAGAKTVVAVGGDGTANEVINGLFVGDEPINPAARFALISIGTGNDLSTVLGLGGDAAHAALGPQGVTHRLDLLRVRYTAPDGAHVSRYALQGLFLGIVAEGAGVALPAAIKRFGRSAYLGAGVIAILRHRPARVTYRFDEGPEHTVSINGGVIANAPRIGGGIPVAPGARLDDGVADAVLLRAVGRVALMTRVMPRLQRGTHLTHPAIRHARICQFAIEADDALLLAIDGEVVGRGSATATIVPGALSVALPLEASALKR